MKSTETRRQVLLGIRKMLNKRAFGMGGNSLKLTVVWNNDITGIKL